MQKVNVRIFLFLFGLAFAVPFLSHASISLNAGSSSPFTAPAYVPYTSTLEGEFELYLGSSTSPIAYCAYNIAGDCTPLNNTVDKLGWTTGGFTSTTVGSYKFVQPRTLGCQNLSYSACSSGNANIPGNLQIDFEVISTGGSSTSSCYGNCIMSTSTDLAIGDFFKWGLVVLEIGLLGLVIFIIFKLITGR